MKKIIALFLVVVMAVSMVACGTETPAESTAASTDATNAPEVTAATYKLGFGVDVKTSSSATGNAQVDATAAAVVLDADGKIVACKLDVAQNKMAIADGKVPDDAANATYLSKQEKKDDYGMVAYGNAIAEWYVQADAFAKYVVGKTADEVENIPTVTNDHGTVAADADLAASCTMQITDFMTAIVKACNDPYAKEFKADEFKLGLAMISETDSSTASASADGDGTANMYTEFAAVVVSEDGAILADLTDAIQPKITFNTAGEITLAEDYAVRSKKELGDDYGMVAYGNAISEWYAQATAFENYVVGKTADGVTSIPTTENEHGTVAAEADLAASCTISINGFMATVAKACANAR